MKCIIRLSTSFHVGLISRSFSQLKFCTIWQSNLPCTSCSIRTVTYITYLYVYNIFTIRPQSNMLKNLPKILLGISQNVYLLCSNALYAFHYACVMLIIREYISVSLFNFTCAFQCFLNVLLECIEPFNTVQCIFI